MPWTKSALTGLGLFVSLQLVAPASAGDPPVSAATQVPDDTTPWDTGDLDGDGHLDVVSQNNQALVVAFGDGLGGFREVTEAGVPLLSSATRVQVAEATGDGMDDVIVFGSFVRVLPSLGNGQFGASIDFSESPVAIDKAIADINGDGLVDVITANQAVDEFRVYLSLGGGQYAPALHVPTLGVPQQLETTDTNGDGRDDVVVELECQGTAGCVATMVHPALGGGSFGAPTAVTSLSSATLDGLLARDMDGDGFGDVLLEADGAWLLFHSDGAGSFGSAVPILDDTVDLDRRLLVDLTGDGLVDAVHFPVNVFNAWDVWVQTAPDVFELAPGGEFQWAEALVAADMDRDGAVDLVVGWDRIGPDPAFLVTLHGDGEGGLRSAWGGTQVYLPILVDLDHDGRTDLFNVGDLSLARGQPGGHIGRLESLDLGGAGWGRVADMDLDGLLDVVHSTRPGTSVTAAELHVRLATAPADFADDATPLALGSDETQQGLELGDLDGDGSLDAVRYSQQAATRVLRSVLNDGAGELSDAFAVFDAAGSDLNALNVGDLDNDGDLDVLLQGGALSRVRRALNLGGGQLGPLAPAISGPSTTMLFDSILADTDGDGSLDLHVGQWDTVGALRVLARYAGNGDGTFGAATTAQGTSVFDIVGMGLVAADVDHDGDTDVVSFADTLTHFLNDGAGSFTALEAHPAEGDLNVGWRGAVGDVNGDGVVDVVHSDRMGLLVLGDGPWTQLGASLAGDAGHARLSGAGPLTPGSLAEWLVEFAPPSTPGLLVLGLSDLSAPFKGGTLVPFPDVLTPIATDADGELHIVADWPAGGLPSGFQLWSQVWFTGGTPSSTTAVVATVP